MPFATTHILIAIILIELFRDIFIRDNKKFPRYYIFIAAIGSIIPDLDIALYYLFYFFGATLEQMHRTFLHNLFIPLIFFAIGIFTLIFKIKNKQFAKKHITLPTTFFILAFAILLHLILDLILYGNIVLFYPFLDYSIGFNIIDLFPSAWQDMIMPTIDAVLLLFWLFWMEFKLKTRNYF